MCRLHLRLPDEDTDEDITSTSTPAAPSLQAPPSGPITRARARELNYVILSRTVFLSKVLRHLILAQRAVYRVEP
jgi:hypothetical protein